jgi:hypothetical protein
MNLEIDLWQSYKFGFGDAVYQGANRYYLRSFLMQQHKLEIKEGPLAQWRLY